MQFVEVLPLDFNSKRHPRQLNEVCMKINAQNNQILKYLQTGKSLTPMGALKKFGCFRLGARIYDLKRDGHSIMSQMVEVGDKRVARYTLIQSAQKVA